MPEPGPDAQQRAYEHIKGLIVTARYRPGRKLRAREIADSLGMSRTPVREALLRLADDGLAERGGWGFTVLRMTLRDVHEVLEVRKVLELEAARLAAARIDAAGLRRLVDMLDAAEAEHAAGRTLEYLARTRRFHLAIAQAAGNQLLLGMLLGINERIELIGNMLVQRVSNRIGEVIQENREVLAALAARDLPRLETAVGRHVDRARELILAEASEFERELMGLAPV